MCLPVHLLFSLALVFLHSRVKEPSLDLIPRSSFLKSVSERRRDRTFISLIVIHADNGNFPVAGMCRDRFS